MNDNQDLLIRTLTATGWTRTAALAVGGGHDIARIHWDTAALQFVDVPPGGYQDQSFGLTGAIPQNGTTPSTTLFLGRPVDENPGLISTAYISAPGIVTVRVRNITQSVITQLSKLYAVTGFNY